MGGDLAGLQDVAAPGGVEREEGVLLDEQDGRAALVDLADDLERWSTRIGANTSEGSSSRSTSAAP